MTSSKKLGGVATMMTDARKHELRFKILELARGVLVDTANMRVAMPSLTDEEYAYAREFMLGIAERTRPGEYRERDADEEGREAMPRSRGTERCADAGARDSRADKRPKD